MGCTSSKPQYVSSNLKMTREELLAWEKERREKEMEEASKREKERIYQEKDLLRAKSLPVILKTDETVDEPVVSSPSEAARLQRKQAKLKADAEQRWMIFSNLDAVEEADMLHVAAFMQTALAYLPESKSLDALDVEDIDDSPRAMPKRNHGDDVIKVARENSKEFITALRSMSSSSMNNEKIMLPRLNSKNTIQVIRHSSKGTIQVERSNSRNNISIPRMDSRSMITTDPTQIRGMNGTSKADTISASRENSLQNIFALDRIIVASDMQKSVFDVNPKHLRYFNIPTGPVTPDIAQTILNVYKRGGFLNQKSAHKLLRLSYRCLKARPNITHVAFAESDQLVIVGDIHGQLHDLIHIIENAGFPSKNKKYIFNGDFVDRGAFGVECMCLLLALLIAFPDDVILNRGNHEDYAICCTYGFQRECCTKYDDITFGMFVEVFNQIPLFSIVNESIFVVHGGLFHYDDLTLEELSEIKRDEFTLKDIPEGGEDAVGIPRESRTSFLKQMQRDAMWSDPMGKSGLAVNARGAGVAFGPDITRKFMEKNNLKLVVRSHECVRTGFEKPFSGDDSNLLITVFSASNYGGGGNSAAYLVFSYNSKPDEKGTLPQMVEGTSMYYSVYYFDLSHEDDDEDDDKTEVGEFLYASYSDGISMYDIILANKAALLSEFVSIDVAQTGVVTKDEWVAVMKSVIKMNISWPSLFSIVVLHECLVEKSVVVNGKSSDQYDVDYRQFLNSFTAAIVIDKGDDSSTASSISAGSVNPGDIKFSLVPPQEVYNYDIDDPNDLQRLVGEDADTHEDASMVTGSIIDALYSQHRKLTAVFQFFDREHKGTISTEDFKKGCEILNEQLPENKRIKNVEKILNLLDVAQTGEIDINTFFEMFRLSNNHAQLPDATLTGNLSPNTPVSMTGRARAGSLRQSTDDNGDVNDLANGLLMKPSFRRSQSHRNRSKSIDSAEVIVVAESEEARSPVRFPVTHSESKGSSSGRGYQFGEDGPVAIEGVHISIDGPRVRSFSIDKEATSDLASPHLDV